MVYKDVMRNKRSCQSPLVAILLMLLTSLSVMAEPVAFSKVFQVMYDEDGQQFAITDKGVWQVVDSEIQRIDGPSDNNTRYLLKDHIHLFPEHSVNTRQWYDLASLAVVALLFMFVGLYLYYQSALNKRRKAFYERIKAQQQILTITFWATGDEVLDCDLKNNQLTRLNQNANLLDDDELYFQSDTFLQRIHEDDIDSFTAQFKSLIASGIDNYELTYRIQLDGQWCWVAERGSVIERDLQGNASRIISSMRDISSIKHEQELLNRVVDELEKRLKRAEAALAR